MSEQLRMLILEDSEDDAALLLHELKRNGLVAYHERVDTAEAFRKALAQGEWHFILSDYRMPGFNALEALAILKESGADLPFIIVSGKIGEDLAVAAMKAGAGDYVMKGNLSRLVPAIQRELREADERRRRREAEEALNNQFRQITTIFDSMNAVVSVADMVSHELLFMNRFGALLVGEEWQGKKSYEVLNYNQSQCSSETLVRNGEPRSPHVWEYQNPVSGRWYQCIDKAVYWPDGKLVRLQIGVDISERKEIEQMKDEMISAVSHEMRTPLTAMLGFTEYLLENEVDPLQLRNYLNTIHKETERLKDLIGNFLDLQQINARMTTYRMRPVDVCMLIRDAAGLFALDAGGSRLVMECPPDLPPVQGDEARLHQALTNVISNGLKYSPVETRVTVGAETAGDQVVMRVKDEGCGIPVELQEKIFEKFYRIDNSDRRHLGGTGLGLALVREIVTAHGGRVWVKSEMGKGSTFYISLPKAG
ncbi:hybrid sensor histidine kinase/response regulator [Geotalea sp. SG265]|uniref:ATP-binding response regulator n=1 Tax=Geotalea sp. SG265 TaxID=2922867 RepID=UPI001FAF8605|nr:hybrid sensor histidine kinase/response regulator [Geotalea sp. SG265]